MREVSPNKVLLVDDDAAIRDLLSWQLGKVGFEAVHAGDPIEALAILRNMLPKVIISDLQMPRMSGFEFINVMRRRFPSIPVIVLSGSIPSEPPAENKSPDRWIEKRLQLFPELVQAVQDLARITPDRVDLPRAGRIHVRTQPGFAGDITLTCPECLRTFTMTTAPGNERVEHNAVCIHCKADVPFLIESSSLG